MQLKTFLGFIILSTTAFLLTGCESAQNGAGRPEAPAVPVVATMPVVTDITNYLEAIGTLQPDSFVEIRPQISGTLDEVIVKEGQWVEKEAPLFKIDSKQQQIKVQEAKAQLSSDEATLRALQKKIARSRDLVEKDYMSKAEWEELEAQEEKTLAAISQDQARLKYAQIDLEHTIVTSSLSGRVGKVNAYEGLLVAAGQAAPLTTVSKMDPLTVDFSLTEKEFSSIPKEDLKIEVQAICAKEPCQTGEVTFLDNHFDPKTGLLFVRGALPNPNYSLRPGQTVRVKVPIAVIPNALLIPQKAIRYNQQGPFVYIVKPDQTVTIRQVKLGTEHATDQIILDGLEPTEQIILDGHLRLSEGIKVEIK